MASGPNVSSGRRGYLRYAYGNHYWIPEIQADWSRGMIRDTASTALPAGSVFDAADFLLHQPGVAERRGETIYAGPAMTAATYAKQVIWWQFGTTPQLLGVGDNGHLYTVGVVTTDVATLGATFASPFRPVVAPAGASNVVVFFASNGSTIPKKWTGAAASDLAASAPVGVLGAVYKSRLVIANSAANTNRIWFSAAGDATAVWDTANSWIDTEEPIYALAALPNVLLIFHSDYTERIIGAVPPPNSDMDKAIAWHVGANDNRSIVVRDGICIFANPRGVYSTNGSTPVSLTQQGGIETYWRGLFRGYDSATWTISCSMQHSMLFVTILDDSRAVVGALMCYLPRRAWSRLTNIAPMMMNAGDTTGDTVYYADATTNRVTSLTYLFKPSQGSGLDANGTAILPTITFGPFGNGPGVKSFGFGRIDYSMNTSGAPDPVLGIVTSTTIIKEDNLMGSSFVPAESPLAYSSAVARKRFSICRDGQTCFVKLTQTHQSDNTEIYAVEVEQRPQSMVGDGVS